MNNSAANLDCFDRAESAFIACVNTNYVDNEVEAWYATELSFQRSVGNQNPNPDSNFRHTDVVSVATRLREQRLATRTDVA